MRTTAVVAAAAFAIVLAGISAGGLSMAAAAAAPQATSIPVLTWHELNNGCASSAPVCNASDPESVSTAQLTAELAYLKAQSYHTVTPAQYMAWAQGSNPVLPSKPIFLVADNGIENFVVGAQPILKADGFTMAVAVITGFADGASGICKEPTFEPGCPISNKNWDATWAQLKALSSSVYSFITEAGTAGHFVQTYDPNCTAFYTCMVPKETTAAYESRVALDLSAGQAEIVSTLGAARFNSGLWVVPYSDDGYTACTDASCTPQAYDGPSGWLTSWTASTFPVAFVEDAFRNGLQHERFRIDVQGWMTQTEFQSTLSQDLALGDFTLTNTPPPTPLPPPPPPPPTSTNYVAAIPVLSLDSTTMTAAQVETDMGYLFTQGYHTISAASYVSWAAGTTVALPTNPILLTVTGGNDALLSAISPYLVSDGYHAVDFVSTQQADAGGPSATWAQLAALTSSAWQFSFSSGAAGGTLVGSDPSTCNIYYACQAPTETSAAYETRVANEIGTGRLELDNSLWMQTVNDFLWSAPFGDGGQAGVAANGPSGWLAQWAGNVFPVVFVPSGANGNGEHDVLALTGSTSQATFTSTLASDLAAGTFNGPPSPLPPPPPPPPTSTNYVAAIPVLSLDSTTMTAAQVETDMGYLFTQGYHTISAASYVSWAAGTTVALPTNPILLTVTGGNDALLSAISPYLVSDGYSAVDFVSTQQADAGGPSATWAQLAALTSSAWQFSFSSGAAGGTLVGSDPSTCNIYYACQAPTETSAAYETRVANEIGTGRLELDNSLWMQTVNDFLWSAPFGDGGQAGVAANGPSGWLAQWAGNVFPVVFVPSGANGNGEHDVLALTGSTSQATFTSTLASDLAAGTFNGPPNSA